MYSHTFLVTSVRAIFFPPDRAQRLTELLGSEDTLPGLLLRERIFLASGLLRRLAQAALLRGHLLQRSLRDRRLLRGRRGHSGLRGGRHGDRRMQVHANVEP